MSSILFLNENPIPTPFTRGTVSGKELRLRSALDDIDTIHVLAAPGSGVDIGDMKRGELEKNITVHHIPPFPYYLRAIPLFLWGIILTRRYHPDWIEAESPIISGVAGLMLSKLFFKPLLVEYRASYQELIKQKLTWIPYALKYLALRLVTALVLKNAQIVVANSAFYKEKLQARGIKSITINPGIQYPPQNMQIEKSDRIIIGYLGRLEKEKGPQHLIEIAPALRNKMDRPFEIHIAGSGSSAPLLNKMIKKKGLEKYVKLLGMQPNYKTLSTFTLLVNPGTSQAPLEMVNAEAAYMGVPVIAFGNHRIPETVVHNKTGLIVPIANRKKLLQAIIRLSENDKLRMKFSHRSKKFAESNYSFKAQVKKLHAVYLQHDFL